MCDEYTPLVPCQIRSTTFFRGWFVSKLNGWWSGKQRQSLRCSSLCTWRHTNEMSACDAWAMGSIFRSVCTNVILQANGGIQHKLDPAYMSTAEHSLTHQAHFWDLDRRQWWNKKWLICLLLSLHGRNGKQPTTSSHVGEKTLAARYDAECAFMGNGKVFGPRPIWLTMYYVFTKNIHNEFFPPMFQQCVGCDRLDMVWLYNYCCYSSLGFLTRQCGCDRLMISKI